jgi:hypothetical protein
LSTDSGYLSRKRLEAVKASTSVSKNRRRLKLRMNENVWHVVAKWRVLRNDRTGLASPLLLLGRCFLQ